MAQFTVDDGNTTVTFEYTAETAKIQSIVGDAAEYLFGKGYGDHGSEEEPVVFDDLTNQEKLDIVDEYVKKVVVDCANTFKSVKAQDEARTTEAESEYSL